MKKLDGLKIALCQMPVVPGKPDVNAAYVIEEIRKADERGVDIIVVPEMSISGYLIGDLYEDDAFVRDVDAFIDLIIAETVKYPKLTLIFGGLSINEKEKGEDGRMLKENTAFFAQNGIESAFTKTLQPNYRMFDDDRHFYSARKRFMRAVCECKYRDAGESLKDFFIPVSINTRIGVVTIGVILCEDMWHEDYLPLNPTKYFVENGAEIIFNLSASPWSWQKNRKRHSVVKKLLAECKVPFVYVNNTGIQNNGKNIVVFDGSSTVYNPEGEIVFEIPPYAKGSRDMEIKKNLTVIKKNKQDDSAELYAALSCGVREFFPGKPPVLVGLSGGVDSVVDAALVVDAVGVENVFATTMPSRYTSKKTFNRVKRIADNLGIQLDVNPIQEIVDAIAMSTGVEPDTLPYENIQARVRMEILAAKAQKMGGMFIGNCNKVELAFGYGTIYGDIAGCLLPIGDLLKREVYQIGDYQNRVVFGRRVIPQECFDEQPTAELKKDQSDPFDYGKLHRRGYHDEMVRALVEFRKNPEWFMEMYLSGQLEKNLMLESGHLAKLFPSAADFIRDLERCWQMFHSSVFKQVQAPPIIIVSKRAFGYDLRRSMLPAHFTVRYQELKRELTEKGF